MSRRTVRLGVSRAAAAAVVLLGAIAGMVLLSGTGQPVTAQPYPRWQQVADPPLSPRACALGVRVGPRVLVLGGRSGEAALRDGASYDVRTGRWRHLRTPVVLTSYDGAVAAAGVAVIRHRTSAGRATWWSFDPTPGTWRRLAHVPRRARAPWAFGSEVYALSDRRVVVYSVALGRWTPLPIDPLRPALTGRRVTASPAGIVVTGRAGRAGLVADRWDGRRWHRRVPVVRPRAVAAPSLPAGLAASAATVIPVGGRLLVVDRASYGRGPTVAWIRTP